MSARTIDRLSNTTIFTGLILIGVATWIAFGLPALLAYVGTVLLLTGIAAALAAPALTRKERT
jgi:hypothetical protein